MTNIKSLVFFTGRNRDLQGGDNADADNADADNADADNADADNDNADVYADLGTLSPMALSKHFMAAPMAVTS